MKKMTFLLIAVLPLVSCKNRSETSPVAQKYEEQKEELEVLGRELTELRIKSRAAKTEGPKKPVEDLRKEVAGKVTDLNEIEAEFKTLEASEAASIKVLEDYRAKYRVPQ